MTFKKATTRLKNKLSRLCQQLNSKPAKRWLIISVLGLAIGLTVGLKRDWLKQVLALNDTTKTWSFTSATIFGFIFKSTFKLGSFKEKFDQLVDKVSNLKTDLEILSKDVQHLIQDGDIIRTHLVSTTGLDANLFTSQSPLQFTKKGKKSCRPVILKKFITAIKRGF